LPRLLPPPAKKTSPLKDLKTHPVFKKKKQHKNKKTTPVQQGHTRPPTPPITATDTAVTDADVQHNPKITQINIS
jgi:hypothetical protein